MSIDTCGIGVSGGSEWGGQEKDDIGDMYCEW